MLTLNLVIEVYLNVDLDGAVQVISQLASAYKDYAAAQFLFEASKRLRK